MADRDLKVMVSSTFRDLKAEREAARDAILGQRMLPLMMETDSAIPDRGLLTNSFKMVDDADIYVLLISNYRYGQIIPAPDLNPKNLSITELEFERAAAKGLKICAYLMEDGVQPPSAAAVFAEAATKPQLDAFRARAQHHVRITANFVNAHDLKAKIIQTLANLRAGQSSGSAGPPEGTRIPIPDRCVGRSEDTDRIVAALTAAAHPTAVLVQGPGGIGKTTLTQEAANHPSVLARFGQCRWFAELETATDRDTFDARLLLALGLDPTQGFAAATQRLAQAPALLVLDNLETPWEGAGPAIEARLAALAAIPGIALLTSFRGQEAVGGARWTLRHRVAPLSQPEARALFLDIAGSIPGDDPDLPALLDALGGVPLAICLTARRAAHRPDLAGLWAEWQRIGPEIATWQGTSPGRLTSVPHSIALSLRSPRLNPDAHRLFALLGPSPAGLAARDQTALLGDAAFAAEDGLVAVGLAYHRGPRLDLLPPVRDYASRWCPPAEAEAAGWCRHFLDRTRTDGGRIFGDGGAEALTDLTPEIPNIDAALRAAPSLSMREPAVAALEGVQRLLSASGAGSPSALDALARACADAADTAGEARCHYWRGLVAQNRPDHDTAWARYEEALPLFRRVGEVLGEAYCILRLGDIAQGRSDHDTARARYEEALPLFRHVGNELGEANCIYSLGNAALARSDYDTARTRYEEALPLYRRVGGGLGEANCIKSLGDVARSRSDRDTARTRYEEALPLYRRVGSVLGEANCILGQGDLSLAKGDTGESERYFHMALSIYERVHRIDNIAVSHERLASVTEGADRAAHVQAAREAWLSMNLPAEAERVTRHFA